MKNTLKTIIRYGLYPFLLLGVVSIITLTISYQWDYKTISAAASTVILITLIAIEFIFPMTDEWKMTKRSFFRDVKYMVSGIIVITLTRIGFSFLAIYYSENYKGLFSTAPFLISVIGYLLAFEFVQYWFHRYSHEGKGKLGRFLGDIHLAHHLPDKVYILMHAVFHPLNAIFTVIILQIPLIILGISPAAIFAANLLIGLQATISHFNVDIKAGFLNYIFIGTETHRNHHSANLDEAKNYGSTLSIWDIVFGTFYYKSNSSPARLGVDNPENFPQSNNLWQVISYPFRKLKTY
jgi:sterol desaturase/sphingolipid hydroxylase (fatty acid hydroxylase superfamily)